MFERDWLCLVWDFLFLFFSPLTLLSIHELNENIFHKNRDKVPIWLQVTMFYFNKFAIRVL